MAPGPREHSLVSGGGSDERPELPGEGAVAGAGLVKDAFPSHLLSCRQAAARPDRLLVATGPCPGVGVAGEESRAVKGLAKMSLHQKKKKKYLQNI